MDEKQKNLLRLIMENKPADDFSGRVIELVKSAKTNARWRQKYMEYERQRTYDMDAGELRGIQKNKIENARNLIKLGTVKFEDISSAIGLPMEQILELAKEVEAEKISV